MRSRMVSKPLSERERRSSFHTTSVSPGAEIVRHYTFSPEDLALIRRRRRDANRLGFAVLLAYLRFPGRVRGAAEVPPANMLSFIAGQLGCDLTTLDGYARREETRWEHLGELQAYLGVRPFQREDYRVVTKVAVEQATGTDRGHAIVSAMVTDLRQRGVILPAALELERIGKPKTGAFQPIATPLLPLDTAEPSALPWFQSSEVFVPIRGVASTSTPATLSICALERTAMMARTSTTEISWRVCRRRMRRNYRMAPIRREIGHRERTSIYSYHRSQPAVVVVSRSA